MSNLNYYSTTHWKQLSRAVKRRDGQQCQICGDRKDDPYTILHAHHIRPRADGGADALENLITLCDLCHAVVTPRWLKPWFGSAAINKKTELLAVRNEYIGYLGLDPQVRLETQSKLWQVLGISRSEIAGPK